MKSCILRWETVYIIVCLASYRSRHVFVKLTIKFRTLWHMAYNTKSHTIFAYMYAKSCFFGTFIGQQSLANTRYHRYDKLVNRSSTIFITVRWIIEKRRLGTFFQHTRLINPNANGNTRHVNSPCLYVNFKVTYIGQSGWSTCF